MATTATSTQKPIGSQIQLSALRGHVYTMAAAFAGVIFGVLGSLGFVGSYLHSQFASENAALSSKILSVAPSAYTTSACVAPATNSAHVTTAAKVNAAPPVASMPSGGEPGGKGGDGGGMTPPVFVSQMVNGTITNTGSHSTNTITGTNIYSSKTTNNNTVSVTNSNNQTANSGSVDSNSNTNASNAASGSASNEKSTTTDISVSN